ncbi:TPA: hypothetical protein ACOFBV_001274 [Stenotrophomonas maltophilia]|uniref:hypothetical protein n=1 Tax=Stenotrophomonas maltophilia TaxID=40324 RepID=UPI0039C020F5
MAIEVELPDGSIAEFPDGMSDDQISAILKRQFGSGDAPVTNLPVIQAQRPDFSGVTATVDSTADGRQADGWRAGIPRDLAFGARSVLQGLGSLIGAVGGDALGALETKVTGRPVASFRDNAAALGDTLGLPKAQTSGDRVLGDVGEALTGTALTLGGGAALNAPRAVVPTLARAAPAPSVIPTLGEKAGAFLTAQPALQTVSTITGSGAASGTRELGGGPGAQAIAGLAGGLAPGFVPRLPTSGVGSAVAQNLTRRALRGSDPSRLEQTLGEFAEAGVQPSMGQATGNRVLQAAETLLGSVPGSAGVIDRFAQRQAGQFGRRIDQIATSISPTGYPIDAETAGLAIREGIVGTGGFKELSRAESNALYRQLDELMPKDSRVGIDSTREALTELNTLIAGAPAVSRNFMNARLAKIEADLASDTQGIEGVLSRPGMRDQIDQMRADLTNQAQLRRAELAQESNLQRQNLVAEAGDQRNALVAEQDRLRERMTSMIEGRRNQLYQEADELQLELRAQQQAAIAENQRRSMYPETRNSLVPVLSDEEIARQVPTRASIDSRLPTQADIEAQMMSRADLDARVMSPQEINQRVTPDSAISQQNFGSDYVEKQINDYLTSQVDGKLPYEALQKLRSLVGRELDNAGFGSDVPRSMWRPLYGALSRDMEAAVQGTGNPRAAETLAAANKYHSRYVDQLDNIDSIIGKKDGEAAYLAAVSGVRDGPTRIRSIMQALPEAQRKTVSSAFIRRMGRAVGSQQTDEGDVFSMNTFLTNYANTNAEARKVLFGSYGPEFEKNLQTIAKATSRIREGSKVFANPSGTSSRDALITQVTGTISTAGALAATGNAGAALVTILGSLGNAANANWMARFMTSPKYVNWLARTSEKPTGELVSQLQVLRGIAERSRDPEIVQAANDIEAQATGASE